MNRFKLAFLSILLSIGAVGVLGLASASALPAFATTATDNACEALTQIDPNHDCSTKGSGVAHIISVAISILSYVVGIASVIMVIIAGLKYITAGGDSNKISSAKTTLVYALVGIAIVALAQVLIHFVFSSATTAANDKTTSYQTTSQFIA